MIFSKADNLRMNHFVPDWNVEDGSRSLSDLLPQTSHRKSTGPDNELMELLWRNGHVVMQSQNHRKSPSIEDELKQTHKPEQAAKCGGAPANSIQEDDNASWFQYALDDSLEKEFYTEFLHGMPIGDGADDKLNNNEAPMAGEKLVKLGNNGQSFTGLVPKQPTISLEDAVLPKPPVDSTAKHQSFIFGGNTMLPSKPNTDAIMQNNSSGNATRVVNFSHFSRPLKPDIRLLNQQSANIGSDGGGHLELGESSSMMSIRLSACGSNQVQNQFDPSYNMSNDARDSIAREAEQDMLMALPCGRVQTDPYETTVTSSSGGSGCSLGRIRPQGASNQSHKRKGRDVEELESLSEEGEDEFIEAKKPTQRPTTSRRSRAAEVHNLSERRRRDKINEKMRALQELIPHCNKSDKASMLDEAIEYLKSLQLQVQIMWMGSGMAPMMFPGVQQYMPRIDMGMGHVPLLSRAMPSGFPVSQASPTISPANFPNQMQNVHFNEQYARFLGLHHMQPSPQAMSLYAYGSHTTASNQMAAAANATVLPTTNGARPKNVQNGQPGKGGAYSRGF